MKTTSRAIWKSKKQHDITLNIYFSSDRCEQCVKNVGHLEGEVDGPVVRLEPHRAALLQDGLVGGVKPFTQTGDPVVVVVMATGRVVVGLVVVFFMFPQQVGVEVAVGVKQQGGGNSAQDSFESFVVKSHEHFC